MLNSWRGLMVPLSIGADYRLKTFSGGCKLYAVAAMTVAYYNNPVKNMSEVDWGPIPGVSLSLWRSRRCRSSSDRYPSRLSCAS